MINAKCNLQNDFFKTADDAVTEYRFFSRVSLKRNVALFLLLSVP